MKPVNAIVLGWLCGSFYGLTAHLLPFWGCMVEALAWGIGLGVVALLAQRRT